MRALLKIKQALLCALVAAALINAYHLHKLYKAQLELDKVLSEIHQEEARALELELISSSIAR